MDTSENPRPEPTDRTEHTEHVVHTDHPDHTAHTEKKAGAGARILAVLLALVLAFVAAVGITVMISIGDTGTCEDVAAGKATFNEDGECYDGSSTTKTIALVLGWPGSILAGVAALLALGYAIRGRGGRTLIQVIVAAAVLLGLSLLIG